MEEEKKIEGLGGWLILVAIGIVLTPLSIIATVGPLFKDIFSNGSWEALTTEGSPVYNAYWAPFLIGELTVNVIQVLVWIFIAFLFFTKKRLFPKLYIGMLLFSLLFVVLDAFAIKIIVPDQIVFDSETLRDVLKNTLIVAIWVPYMFISKRVKATFIN